LKLKLKHSNWVYSYTAHKTPQQNGCVERKSATLFGRVHAMLNAADYIGERTNLQHGLWAEAVAVATKVENILVSENKPMPAYNSFFRKEAPYAKHLCTFGECSMVHDRKKIRSKLENHGEKCIFVGYTENHAGNVYRMFNLQTRHV